MRVTCVFVWLLSAQVGSAVEAQRPISDRAEQMRQAWAKAKKVHLADPHCVAYYTFEADTFCKDNAATKVRNLGQGGAALDALVHGAGRHAPEGGRFSHKGGMAWDGATHLTVADSAALRPTGEGAIEFWIKPTKAVKGGGYCGIVENLVKIDDGHYGYGVTFCRYQNKPFFYAGAGKGSGAAVWQRLGTTNSETQWTHWITTWRNRDRRLVCYRNGHSVGTRADKRAKRFSAVRYAASSMPLTVGGAKTVARPDAKHPGQPGILGTLAIYDEFVSAEKAKKLYQASALPRPRIVARELGAVADGKTDDWAPIQKAIDAVEAAGGGIVVLSPSETPYVVAKTLRIDSDDVEIVGHGATVKLADQAGDGRVVDVLEVGGTPQRPVQNVKIVGLTVDGNYWAQTDAGNPRCLDFDHVVNGEVRDVHLTRGFVSLTFGRGCSRCTAVNCVATRWHNDGFNASGDGTSAGCYAISFVNCHARNAPNESDGGLAGSRNNAWEIEDGVQDVYLLDCSVTNAGGNGFGIRNHAGYGNEITERIMLSNCTVRNVSRFALYATSCSDTNVVRAVRVLGFRADGPVGFWNGVEDLIVSGRFSAGLELGHPDRGALVKNAEVKGSRTTYLSLFGSHLTVSNVTVDAQGEWGVDVHHGSGEVALLGCTVTGAKASGIRCHGTSPAILNTIVWGSQASLDLVGASRPTISHSCIQGGVPLGSVDGGGNIAADPRYRGAEEGDYALGDDSPCMGSGSSLGQLRTLCPWLDAGSIRDSLGRRPSLDMGACVRRR